MIVLRGLEELRERFPSPVVTIGNFDGVHLGHQALFAKAVERAQAINGTTLAMTFEPHPMRVLRPAVNLPLITPIEQKLLLIEEYGMDVAVCVRFDEDFAALSADDFVDKLLVGRLRATEVVVGYDFTFGRRGLGDLELMEQKAQQHGFELNVVGPVIVEDRPVSSTRVRQEVKAGNLDAAQTLLGRQYRIAGKVVTGHGRGAKVLGFATANLKVSDELLPADGVYAVLVKDADGNLLKGVTNIGNNPTFENGELSVETHLLDYKGDLYGKHIVVIFTTRLRGEVKFPSVDALREQITDDIKQAHIVLDREIVRRR